MSYSSTGSSFSHNNGMVRMEGEVMAYCLCATCQYKKKKKIGVFSVLEI